MGWRGTRLRVEFVMTLVVIFCIPFSFPPRRQITREWGEKGRARARREWLWRMDLLQLRLSLCDTSCLFRTNSTRLFGKYCSYHLP